MNETPTTPTSPVCPEVKEESSIGTYKGATYIILNPTNKFPFQFGLRKAQLVLEHLDEIKKFVESNGATCK